MFNIVSNIIYSITQFLLNAIALIMNWIFQLVNCVGLSKSSFFGAVDKDFVTNIFPKLSNFSADFTSIGYFIAFVLFVFGLFMLLFPYSDFEPPAENAFQLVFRFGIALIMVFAFEKFFLDVIYDKLIVPMFNYFNGAVGVSKSVWEGTEWFLDTLVGRLNAGFTSSIGQVINLILVIVFGLMFIVQAFKFTVYHYEKLFFTRLLIYCIPIASGTLATKKSSAIFKNYFNLLLVNCISLVLNVFICGLIMSGLLNVNSASTSAATNLETQLNGGLFLTCTKTFIAGLMLLTAALKVGKKMSVYISQLFNMNGMSDAVRDGLGMFTMAVGYAGHMISQRGMKNAMKNAERNENAGDEKRAKETQASFANLQSSIDDLTNTIKDSMANGSVSKASKGSNAKEIQTDENGDNNLDNPTKQADTASKPGASEQYNNPFKEDNKATDTGNDSKSANNDDKSKQNADKNGVQAVKTDQNNPNNSDEQNSKNGKSDAVNPTQTDNAANMNKDGKEPDNNASIKSEDNGKATQTDNSQIQNNPKSENPADTDKGNVQDNSKLENLENNNQTQKGVNTEDGNTSIQNKNKSEGKNIENTENNGGKSVQGNNVDVNNKSSHSEKKSASQGGANISANDRGSHPSSSQGSSVQQNNTSSQHTANTVTGGSSSSGKSGSTGSGNNVSGKGNSTTQSTAQSSRVENRTNSVNTSGSNNNPTHSAKNAPESGHSNNHGRSGSHNTKNVGNKTEL